MSHCAIPIHSISIGMHSSHCRWGGGGKKCDLANWKTQVYIRNRKYLCIHKWKIETNLACLEIEIWTFKTTPQLLMNSFNESERTILFSFMDGFRIIRIMSTSSRLHTISWNLPKIQFREAARFSSFLETFFELSSTKKAGR